MSWVIRTLRAIERLNEASGAVLALITPLAIGITVLEVVLRYVFNAPTNWAHESSTLLFGAQYMLSGAYAHCRGQHVNVDVISSRWSARTRAVVDILTAPFFFLFVGALAYTSWTFFWDSWQLREHSASDWAPAYYPIKFTIPLACALLGLQGLVNLSRDLHLAVLGRKLPC